MKATGFSGTKKQHTAQKNKNTNLVYTNIIFYRKEKEISQLWTVPF